MRALRCTLGTPTRRNSEHVAVAEHQVEQAAEGGRRDRHRRAKIRELVEAEGDTTLALRMAVRPGGCSGFSYEMFFDSEIEADDIVEEFEDVRSSSTRSRSSVCAARCSTTRTV
jgi:hypothetical protein